MRPRELSSKQPGTSTNVVPTVVALGEVLWDIFPTEQKFGGAPANFACSLAGLSQGDCRVELVSATGNDPLGHAAMETLGQHGVALTAFQQKQQQTGSVLVKVDAEGCASYKFAKDSAWDNLNWTDEIERLAADATAVCFGTLGQRSLTSRETIRRFVKETRARFRICDINLRSPYYDDDLIRDSIGLCNVLKLNDEEFPVVCQLFDIRGNDRESMHHLADQLELEALAVTRGSDGARIIRGGELSEASGPTTDVVDTVGAGDAFTAALTLGLLTNSDLDTTNQVACRLAAFVCSQSGATPKLPDSIRFPRPDDERIG